MASSSRDSEPGKTMSSHHHKYSSRIRTRKEKKTYSEDWAYGDEEEIEGVRSFSLQEKLDSTRYLNHNFVKQMDGKDFTISYLQKYGFIIPLLFKDKTGLGLHVPSPNFSVNDVRTCVGSRRMLDVMDVNTQKNFEMTMKEWTKYYEEPVKDKLLNVISLEFSHTKLENYIKRPNIVRELDWVDCVWPKHLKESQTESTNVIDDMMYPKVQKYCLMSVKGCYTDFHIDFGGTSVWYHILKGSKVFWLIPPTEQNIKLYEQWILSGKQGDIFFGDTVEQCGRVSLNAGDTFFIPTGWIHAVYTPKDSLVFGGNFLHSFGIEKQLRVAEVEESTKVPQKFRYPFFTEMLWYVLERYVYCDLGKSHLTEGAESSPAPVEHIHFTKQELHGIKAIVRYLHILPANKKNVPPLIKDAIELIRNVAIVINKHKNDKPEDAISGKPILKIQGDKERERRFYKTSGDMNAKVKTSRKTASGSGPRRRRTRCKKCEACKQADCGECSFCRDMVKFGGPGRAKQTCVMRQCLQPMLPITAACGICSLDGWGQQIIIPIQKTAKDTPSQLMECSVCFEIVHPDCLLKQPVFTNIGTYNEDLPNSWECPKCCKEGKNLESKPRHFRARQKSSDIRRTSVSSNDTNPQKRYKDDEEYSDTNSESDLDNVSNKRLKTEKKENLSTERSPPLPSTETQPSLCKNALQQVPATASSIETSAADKSDFENKTPHKKFRRNLTEEKKPATSEPGTSGGNSTSNAPMVAMAAVAPTSPEVKLSDGDGSKQTTKRPAEPAEMNVMEAFDRCIVKRSSSPTVIKMEAAERPFESANTVADSGVIVKREKLSPIRISEYIPETKVALEQPSAGSGPVSGSVKIEEEIRTNEPIANNADVPIDEILSNSKKSNHMPKYVIRPVPKLDTDEKDKDPRRRCTTLVHVFKFLSAEDLKHCSLVCKDWYTATINPVLWNRMDLTETVITPKLIKYVMIRQPKVLILDWCKITKEQLSWLLVRLPQSKALSLQGCPWSTVSCLRSCVCPMLTSLNLSFVPTMDDAALQHILSPPLDHRPGLLDLACRLSNLKSLKLAGSNVTDAGVQIIVRVLPKLSMLDLSQCFPITDDGVELLTQISGLSTLQLSGCTGISEQSLKLLGKCKSLTYLDLRHTKLTKSSINKFVSNREGFKAFDSKLIVKVDKS
ncbi:jmjC domain-containing histone demethylation protein 1 isoform X1 [Rhopalosiphum maidis]|uniref:jmjC domain-containing histone demethylation protein 1 isoform X1 n=1 Tax=Rhopalosiphum maidis TaxID=43146 RepID=UPI000EFF81D4|nr:jmjC domain-containing histone demethylation protein 1 isoform X1 [Rhopalosiphum maidis]